jgi:hypothetical protein
MKNNMDESGVFARAPNTSRSPGSILRGQKCLFIILMEELPRHFFLKMDGGGSGMIYQH